MAYCKNLITLPKIREQPLVFLNVRINLPAASKTGGAFTFKIFVAQNAAENNFCFGEQFAPCRRRCDKMVNFHFKRIKVRRCIVTMAASTCLTSQFNS